MYPFAHMRKVGSRRDPTGRRVHAWKWGDQGRREIGKGPSDVARAQKETGDKSKICRPCDGGRRGGIRTRDPLHPMQVRYQAALHAEALNYSPKDGPFRIRG